MKRCPYCSAELPDEAVYCLNCSSVINDRQEIIVTDAEPKQKKLVFTLKKLPYIPKKKLTGIIAALFACAIIFTSCFFAVKSIRTQSPEVADDTSTPPETTVVPVTEENGEIATNDVGEQIYELIEITETTTKKSLLNIIFDKTEKNDDGDKDTDTTENEHKAPSSTTEASSSQIEETECTTTPVESETSSKNETTSGTATSTTVVRTTIVTRPATTTETTTKKSFWDMLAEIETTTKKATTTTTRATTTTTRATTTTTRDTTTTTKATTTTRATTTTTTKPATTTTTTTRPATTTTTTRPATTTTTTTKPATTTTTTKKVTTTTPTTSSSTANTSDFEYTEVNGEIKITKYTGSSSTVTVPAYINNKHVAFLGENAFAGNSSITKIVFEGTTSGTSRFYLPTNRVVFNNLPNLTSITFPYETYYRMTSDSKSAGNSTFYNLIINCPKLSSINFTSKVNSDYSSSILNMYSVDGVVFARQNTSTVDSALLYYPPAKTTSAYTIPSRVSSVEKFAFQDNPYVKSIHFTTSTLYVAANFTGCSNLAKFTVDSGNTKLFAENDVLYTGGVSYDGVQYKSFFYPPAKTATSFTFNADYNLSMDGYSFCGNPYLKTAKFCRAVRIDSTVATGAGKPTALTTFELNNAYVNTVNTSKTAYTYNYY